MLGRQAQSPLPFQDGSRPNSPLGSFVVLDGENYYRIAAFHHLAPFLMSIASDTDLWMFIASEGGLTAGRVDAEGSLFPYQTVDQLHDAHHHTGPVTLFRIEQDTETPILWEPFAATDTPESSIERNLYKNTIGNRLVFEEINHELELAFRYRWSGCDEFGWVRTATLENTGSAPVRATLLDGLRNVLPHGAPLSLYQTSSNLVDAYKKTEADPETGLGIFSLTAGITDRAEALESFGPTRSGAAALEGFRVHLSLRCRGRFPQRAGPGRRRCPERNPGQLPGFRQSGLEPAVNRPSGIWSPTRGWTTCGSPACTAHSPQTRPREPGRVASLDQAGENLRQNVGSADGLQMSGRPESWTHHFANVLFNNMRGGVFDQNHDIPVADFARFPARTQPRRGHGPCRTSGRLPGM